MEKVHKIKEENQNEQSFIKYINELKALIEMNQRAIKVYEESIQKFGKQKKSYEKLLWETFKPKYQFRARREVPPNYMFYRGNQLKELVYIELKASDESIEKYNTFLNLVGSCPSLICKWSGMYYQVENNKIIRSVGGGTVTINVEQHLWYKNELTEKDKLRLEITKKRLETVEQWLRDTNDAWFNNPVKENKIEFEWEEDRW